MNLIIKQLLIDELLKPEDVKHTPRRNSICLASLTSGHGALAYLQAIPTHNKLSIPNDRLIIAIRRTLGLPLLLPHLAEAFCNCGQRSSLGTLQKSFLYPATQHYSRPVQILF
jgi:hypothetical protein